MSLLRRLSLLGSAALFCSFLLALGVGCESPSDKSEQAQKTPKEASEPADEELELSLEERQKLWRCAVQRADRTRAEKVRPKPGPVFAAVRATLTPADSEEARYDQMRKNWNTEWDPARILSWSVGWGHRGLEVFGEADSAGDVAEFLQRLQSTSDIGGLGLDSMEATDADDVRFHFVRYNASQSAAEGAPLESVLRSGQQTGVKAVLARACDWGEGEDEPSFEPPQAFSEAEWEPREPITTDLHRLYGWRARLPIEVDAEKDATKLEELVEAATAYDGVRLDPGEEGLEVTLYQLVPRTDATFAPPNVSPGQDEQADVVTPWSPTAGCDEPMCGVEFGDGGAPTSLLELIERADQLRTRLVRLDRLESASFKMGRVADCLEKLAPVEEAGGESSDGADSDSEPSVSVSVELAKVKAFDLKPGKFEVSYLPAEGVGEEDVADALESCLKTDKREQVLTDVAVESVDSEQPPLTLRGSYGSASAAKSGEDPPPWDPDDELSSPEELRLLAGEKGRDYQKTLRSRVAELQQELLIAREKVPASAEVPGLVQRIHNQITVFGGELVSFEHVFDANTTGLQTAVTHRYRVRFRADGPRAIAVPHLWTRMTRIVVPQQVRLRPADSPDEPGLVDATLDTYSYRGR